MIASVSECRHDTARLTCLLKIVKRFDPSLYVLLARLLGVVQNPTLEAKKVLTDDERAKFLVAWTAVEENLSELGLTMSTRTAHRTVQILLQPDVTWGAVGPLAFELEGRVSDEMTSQVILAIDADRRMLYEQPEPPFRQAVAERFPDANRDIAAAGRCLTLEEWTAAVFHLMRVLEQGLRALGACPSNRDRQAGGRSGS
jgi:hypothetical protein